MPRAKYLKIILCIPLLCACTKGQGISLHQYKQEKPTRENFKLCHGYSCTHRTDISISDENWKRITSLFANPAANAKAERQNIAHAMALIEKTIIDISGMIPDRAEAKNFETDKDQMDCLDETINTSRYLSFLEKENAFKFHKTSSPIHRGYFIDGLWPHNTATITEIQTGDIYAVDSYYAETGLKAHIIPKDIWLDDWSPE